MTISQSGNKVNSLFPRSADRCSSAPAPKMSRAALPHALVNVWANLTEFISTERPVVGFRDFPLICPFNVGDHVTATQEVFGLVSDHSYLAVTVDHQPGSLAAPTVGTRSWYWTAF